MPGGSIRHVGIAFTMERQVPDNKIAPGSGLAGRGDVVVVNIFGDATRIARLLGLDVELPDPGNVDPDYWKHIHADGGYKPRIADKIADPWLSGDPDWALLKRLPWGEVWFDIEEGVKLFVVAADVTHATDLIDVLRTRGLDLSDEEGSYGRNWVMAL